MLITPFALKQLWCNKTIEAQVTPTKKLKGDSYLISMPKLLEGGMGLGGMGYHHRFSRSYPKQVDTTFDGMHAKLKHVN